MANKERICYPTFVAKRLCDVTTVLRDGTRHTTTVEATSVYEAAEKARQESPHLWPHDRKPAFLEVRPLHYVQVAALEKWKLAKMDDRDKKRMRFRLRRLLLLLLERPSKQIWLGSPELSKAHEARPPNKPTPRRR
jgi:hypothetical protein